MGYGGDRVPLHGVGLYGFDGLEWVEFMVSSDGDMNVNIHRWGHVLLTGRDITPDIQSLGDDAVKGVLRSLGDAGVAPTNTTGETMLHKLQRIARALDTFATTAGVANSIGDPGIAATAPTTAKTLLKLLEDILTALGAVPTAYGVVILDPALPANQFAAPGQTPTLDTGLYGGRDLSFRIWNLANSTSVDHQVSVDGAVWYAASTFNIGAGGGSTTQHQQSAFRYHRFNVTAVGGGITYVMASAGR